MLQRSHVLVCVTRIWLRVKLVTGLQCHVYRHQAVVLFLYSERLPLCFCTKTPSRMCESMSIDYCYCPNQSCDWQRLHAQLRHYCLHQTCRQLFHTLCKSHSCLSDVQLGTIRTKNLINNSCLLVSQDSVLRVTQDLSESPGWSEKGLDVYGFQYPLDSFTWSFQVCESEGSKPFSFCMVKLDVVFGDDQSE